MLILTWTWTEPLKILDLLLLVNAIRHLPHKAPGYFNANSFVPSNGILWMWAFNINFLLTLLSVVTILWRDALVLICLSSGWHCEELVSLSDTVTPILDIGQPLSIYYGERSSLDGSELCDIHIMHNFRQTSSCAQPHLLLCNH